MIPHGMSYLKGTTYYNKKKEAAHPHGGNSFLIF